MANTPFSPRDVFGTDVPSTRDILTALLQWLRDPTPENASAANAIADKHAVPSTRAFWTGFFSSVYAAREALPVEREPGDFSALAIESGVPFFDAVLRAGTIDAFNQSDEIGHHFTVAGKARSRYGASSRSGTPAPSEAGLGDDPKTAAPASKARPTAQELHDDLEERLTLYTTDEEDAALAMEIDPISKDHDAQQARRHKDKAGVAPSRSRTQAPQFGQADPEVAASSLLDAAFADSDDDLSDDVRRTRALASSFRRKARKEKVRLVAQNASNLMPIECAEAVILNKYVDFDKVYAHDPAASAVAPLSLEQGELFLPAPAPSTDIDSAHAFLCVYDKVVKFTLKFYPHRASEFKAYRAWFSGQTMRRPDLFEAYKRYDYAYRKNLGSEGHGHTLVDAKDDSSSQLVHFMAPVYLPPAPASRVRSRSAYEDSGPSSPSKHAKTEYPKGVCLRFNLNKDHDEAACKAFTPPRRHAAPAPRAEELEEEHMARVLGPSSSEGAAPSLLPGLSSFPRLRRALHFPSISSPSSPAIDSTLSAPPLPSVPLHHLSDPLVAGTIERAPHLFGISTPFRIRPLRALLAPHPNRPLIASILHGLEHGFWPSFEGSTSDLNALSPGLPPTNLTDNDHEFITRQLEKDFEKGFLSEPFDTLLPGMVVSPMFVVRLAGRKPCAVVDQTASGLNDGISREAGRVTYDTIAELARLLRYRRRRGEDSASPIVWKSDVSGAFRTIAVAVQWQVRQVPRSRIWDAREKKHKIIYYVDQRLVFGGRFSPRLWCTVINVVLWGVRHHLLLEFPLIYVDNAFGFDVSGLFLPVVHLPSGESRLVPRDQARVLFVWNHVGAPWDWEKQVHGHQLIVLGHLVDGRALTVALPGEAKTAFVDYIADFLADSDSAPPLFRWQRLTGYGQWACTTLPLARFALNSLYAKITGKTKRNAKVRLNKTVERDLRWLIGEVSSALPLDLLDPALEDWADRSADVVLYSDACLKSDGGHASTRHSPMAPSSAQSLAIASAISHVVHGGIARKKVLLFSDSALSVYAFDSGRAPPDVSELVLSIYELLRASKIDLRVRHVAGDINATADKLSRLPPDSLRRMFPSLLPFTPFTPSVQPSLEGAPQ
ncbi:hypothetical protein JCM5296_003627 [Sporobolomyces johnsonii]